MDFLGFNELAELFSSASIYIGMPFFFFFFTTFFLPLSFVSFLFSSFYLLSILLLF